MRKNFCLNVEKQSKQNWKSLFRDGRRRRLQAKRTGVKRAQNESFDALFCSHFFFFRQERESEARGTRKRRQQKKKNKKSRTQESTKPNYNLDFFHVQLFHLTYTQTSLRRPKTAERRRKSSWTLRDSFCMPSGVFSVESKEKRQKIPSQHQRTKTRCGNSFFPQHAFPRQGGRQITARKKSINFVMKINIIRKRARKKNWRKSHSI